MLTENEKKALVKKLVEDSKDYREVSLFEAAKEIGISHIKREQVEGIVERFMTVNNTHRPVQMTNPNKMESTQSLFTSLIFTSAEYDH